jgi:serine/threonine protein kinase
MPFTLQPGAEPVPGYRLVRRLGEGGFGEVWEAQAPGDFPVALKFVPLNTTRVQPELRALRLLRTVRHPHLLDIQWAVPVEDRLVIAMPLCDRSVLDRYRECAAGNQPGIPRAELLRYLGETAGALDFLNEPRHPTAEGRLVGIQHRDIKPHNLLLAGGSVRVADFGLAKVLAESVESHSGSMTLVYAPPEFFRSEFAATSDQYSLAVTYCELRCGQLPFAGTVHTIVHKIMHSPPDLSGLPPEEQPVVARALAKDPEQRWPSCREFVDHLQGSGPAVTVALRTDVLRQLANEVRHKTLQILAAVPENRLTWAPAGTANHLLWHAGHSLWVQDALCVQIVTGRSELPPSYADLFAMGSRPDTVRRPWPTRRELLGHLQNQLRRLEAVIRTINDSALDRLPPHPHGGDRRLLGECILHGLHDEANHQGEMYLLFKMLRLDPART